MIISLAQVALAVCYRGGDGQGRISERRERRGPPGDGGLPAAVADQDRGRDALDRHPDLAAGRAGPHHRRGPHYGGGAGGRRARDPAGDRAEPGDAQGTRPRGEAGRSQRRPQEPGDRDRRGPRAHGRHSRVARGMADPGHRRGRQARGAPPARRGDRAARAHRRRETAPGRRDPMTQKTEAATTGSQQRAAAPFGWRTVTPLVMGSALNPVNSSVIATALVPIAAALHVPVGRTSILVSSLYLACAIAQPTAGKLAEEFGPRRVFLAGIVVVLAGGLVGGLGSNLAVLVVARVLIGVGTSCGYPTAMVIIRRRSHEAGLGEPPGSVLGSLAIAGSATVAIGPPIGGLLVGGLGWRSAFLLNVPLAAAALAMALAWIPRDDKPAAGRKIAELATRIDLVGIALFGGTLTALLVFLMSLPHPGWVALAISAVLAALLAAWELRAARPFIDLRLLASQRALTRTYLRFGLTLLGVYVVLYGITQWMEAARGLSPEQAGLVLLPMGAVAALVSRPVSRRNLVRAPLIACAFFMVFASVATLFITVHSPVIALVGVMILFGVVVGTTSVGNQTALYLQSPPESLGTASGLSRTFGYIGSIASATITSIVFHTRVSDAGLHEMALILVGVAAAVMLMTFLDRQLPSGAKT